jgi:hypothetical protein
LRYITPVVRGPWRRTEAEALGDALTAGQAYLRQGRVTLFEFAQLEELPPELGADAEGARFEPLKAQSTTCMRFPRRIPIAKRRLILAVRPTGRQTRAFNQRNGEAELAAERQVLFR